MVGFTRIELLIAIVLISLSLMGLYVENGTSLTVNGSVIALGNIHASSGGPFNVNYQPSSDPNITGQAFTVKH
jgi:hypothetical protein